MKWTIKIWSVIIVFVVCFSTLSAQIGAGMVISNDIYNQYRNPTDGIAHCGNGSAILNLAIGPKLWVGGKKFSVSAEAQANLSPLGLAATDYKGLGAVSFPILAKLNFGGLSGFNKLMKAGFSVGGGIQYNKTEIFGISEDYVTQGVERDFFKTYNIQLGAGMGVSGFSAQLFGRYGFNSDLHGAQNLHIGLQLDFNFVEMTKIDRPESAL